MQTFKSAAAFLKPRRASDGKRGRFRPILPRNVLAANPVQWPQMRSFSREERYHEAASAL